MQLVPGNRSNPAPLTQEETVKSTTQKLRELIDAVNSEDHAATLSEVLEEVLSLSRHLIRCDGYPPAQKRKALNEAQRNLDDASQ